MKTVAPAPMYPYEFIDRLGFMSSPENITNREVVRAINEVGNAICVRLDRIIETLP